MLRRRKAFNGAPYTVSTKRIGTSSNMRKQPSLCILHFAFCIILSALGSTLSAQVADTTIFSIEKNVIENAKTLNYFFEKLDWLESKNSGLASVLHIGDSHIQADMITQPIRVGLQQRFGNAGRGLVFPHSIVKSNGSASVRGYSKGFWAGGRIVQPQYRKYCGISGFFAATYDSTASLLIKVNDKDSMDYQFAYAAVFAQIGDSAYTMLAGDSVNISYYKELPLDEKNEIRKKAIRENSFVFTELANHPTEYIFLQNVKTGAKQNQASIHGVVLTNGSPGVLYHVAGVNGAHFSDWAATPMFFKEAHDLKPELVIISLGTNEAFGGNLDTNLIYKQIDSLMTGLMAIYPPQTGFLLTTPPDCFKKRKYAQPNLPLVVKTIRRYATDYNMAIWDMNEITGGYGSRTKWKKYGLMGGDGVHFNKAGYNMQGRMLLNAILNAYADYKANKNK